MKMSELEAMQAFMDERMTPELVFARDMMRRATSLEGAKSGASAWSRGYAEGKASVAAFWVRDEVARQTMRNEICFLQTYYWRNLDKFK